MNHIDAKTVMAKPRHISAQFSIEEFGGIKWKNHRWHFRGRQYRSLRQIKSTNWYKTERSIAKTLASEIRKEIDKDILNTLLGIV